MNNGFLSGLGVTMLQQSSRPTTQSFPRRFNPYAATVWMNVCNALDVRLKPAEAWTVAVETFFEHCQKQGTYPMRSTTTLNEDLRRHLIKCREVLLSYLQNVEHPLLDEYTVLEIDRDAAINHEGFSLKIMALFRNTDPTFGQHLLNIGFDNIQGKYVRELSEHLTLSFWAKENNRWNVQYIIKGPHIPEQLGVAGSITNERLSKILVTDLWHSLTRELRPSHVGPRFI